MQTRDSYIDVLRGIGIISIVIGHASWIITIGTWKIPIGPFVYLYHLAIFFFCSGYLFKDNEKEIWSYIEKKLKGLYKPFIIYSVLYIILRNMFIKMGILGGEEYHVADFLIAITNSITFNSVGELLAAFWFLPVLFFSLCIFTFIHRSTMYIHKRNMQLIIRIFICAAIGIVGLIVTEKHYGLLYNMQIVYLMLPIVALGHVYEKYMDKVNTIIGFPGLLFSIFLLEIILKSDVGIINLSEFQIINKYLFYPVTIIGIYFCLCLGKILSYSNKIKKIIAYVGKNSLHIMALHLLCIKIVDVFACCITGQKDKLSLYPHSFNNIWIIYYIVGVALPIMIWYSINKVFLALKRKKDER